MSDIYSAKDKEFLAQPTELEKRLAAKREEEEGTENQEKKENKVEIEKLKALEQVGLAVVELKKIKEQFENFKDKPEIKKYYERLSHTINAVEHSVNGLEQDGDNKGLYKVIIKNREGSQANWPDGSPAFQFEGVPVDEMIDLLSKQAKHLRDNQNKKHEQLKRQVDELWEKYDRYNENIDKSLDYANWETKKKELDHLEKELNKGGSAEAKTYADLAEALTKNSKPYFEAHYGHDLPLTEAESQKQHLRTQHEAYLIAQDYRGSKDPNPDEAMRRDYELAMATMKNRRELIAEKEPKEPVKIETPAVLDQNKWPEKNRLLRVDITDVADRLAYIRADKRLNELLNAGKDMTTKEFFKAFGFKGIWNRMKTRALEGRYRARFVEEEQQKMFGQGKNVSTAHLMTLAQRVNLHLSDRDGDKWKKQSDQEFTALMERFEEDLLMNRDSEKGEKKKTLSASEQAYKDQINKLMNEYIYPTRASGGADVFMTDEQFEARKEAIMEDLSKHHPEYVDANKLSMDDFLETAREYRKIQEHTTGLERLDHQFEVDLGVARAAIKNKVHLEGFSRLVNDMQKVPFLGRFLTPTGVGTAWSVGAYFLKRKAYLLGPLIGAAAIGGARKHKEVTADMMMHRTERAMGVEMNQFNNGKEARRRQEFDKYTYQMRNVGNIKVEMDAAAANFDLEKNEANTKVLIDQIADVEARMILDEKMSLDLIQYEGVTQMERGRLDLMRSLAEAKGLLGSEHNQELQNAIVARSSELQKDISETNSQFAFFRTVETVKGAAVGAAFGVAIGAAFQEGAAKLGDWTGIHWLRPDGKRTSLEKVKDVVAEKLFGIHPAAEGIHQDLKPNLELVRNIDAARVNLPVGTHLLEQRAGEFALINDRDGRVLTEGIKFNPDGTLFGRTQDHVPMAINSRLDPNSTHRIGVLDYVREKFHGRLSKIRTEDWYRNAKVSTSDENELRLMFGGEHGSGYDHNGNVDFDLSHFKEGKSWIAEGPNKGKVAQRIIEGIRTGRIKALLAPDSAHSNDVVELRVGSNGHLVPDQLLNEMAKKGPNGKPILSGMLRITERQPNGKYIDLAAYVGKGDNTKEVHNVITTFVPKGEKTADWLAAPLFFKFPRNPLEDYEMHDDQDIAAREKRRDQIRKTGGAPDIVIPVKPKPKGETEDDDIVTKPLDLNQFNPKFSHVTRGHGLEGSIPEIDVSPGYPEQPVIFTDKEIADSYISIGSFTQEDKNNIRKVDLQKDTQYVIEKVRAERQRAQNSELAKHLPEYLEIAAAALKRTYAKYTKNLNALPDFKKARVIGDYEAAALNLGSRPTGLTDLGTGEIMINIDRLEAVPEEQRIMVIKDVLAHELTHAIDANNYWIFEPKNTAQKVPILRRTGLKFGALRRGFQAPHSYEHRGTAFNEGIKEELAAEVTKNIFGENYKSEYSPFYSTERAVIRVLMDAKKLDFSVLAEASLDRKALPKLIRALRGENRQQREYLEVLLAIMDYEFSHGERTYPRTLSFIRGFPVSLNADRVISFPPSLKDKSGRIKESIMKKYNLRRPSVQQITPAPAAQRPAVPTRAAA